MTENLADGLVSHSPCVRLSLPISVEPVEWLVEELLSAPAVTSGILGLSYSTSRDQHRWEVTLRLAYDEFSIMEPVLLVRDGFEMTCALSVALRMHLPVVRIVVDNRSRFVPYGTSFDELYAYMSGLRNSLGEDLECAQVHRIRQSALRLFDDRVIVYRLLLEYFETPSMLNSLMSVIGEHAVALIERVGSSPQAVTDELMWWLRDNVAYVDTGCVSDHTAVGLVRNGTAVCQGIAVYASQLLWACGIPNRYVTGMGKRDMHAWNAVKVGGRWEHIDYTFALTDRRDHILPAGDADRMAFRACHSWDIDEYADERNDHVVNVKQALDSSIVTFIPEENGYSVNGCIVDTTFFHRMGIVKGGRVWVDAGSLSKVFGGGWGLRDGGRVSVFMGSKTFVLDAFACEVSEGTCYAPVETTPKLGFCIGFGSGNTITIQPY